MTKDNEYRKTWAIAGFLVALHLWFAGRCKTQGKTVAQGLEEVLNKLKQEDSK